MRSVRIGAPIALIVIGAILRWAVSDAISGINLPMVGLILLGAGIVWLVLELILGRPRTQIIREHTDVQGPGSSKAGDRRVEREVRRDDR